MALIIRVEWRHLPMRLNFVAISGVYVHHSFILSVDVPSTQLICLDGCVFEVIVNGNPSINFLSSDIDSARSTFLLFIFMVFVSFCLTAFRISMAGVRTLQNAHLC